MIPTLPNSPPRVQYGRLRVFASAEEAVAYEARHPRSSKICIIAGDVPTLRWRIYRRLPERRVEKLREYLNSARCGGCAFFCGAFGGEAWGYEVPENDRRDSILSAVTDPPKVIASTICRMTGARP